MVARSFQITLDTDHLGRIDADPEARENGRSAFIRHAVALYLQAKEKSVVDTGIRHAYEGESSAMLEEIEDLLGAQAWPED